MSDYIVSSPIAFIIFNRPHTTRQVFAEIAKVRPKSLYVISDGPRADKPGEKELVDESRAIIDQIDWDCEVFTNYSEINLGCKKRVSSGIDWVFEHVDKAIILEDDCLPSLSFFQFCSELLEKYQDNPYVGMISGDNFQFGKVCCEDSYYFSRYAHIWGWATWKRAWKKYDVNIKAWPNLSSNKEFWRKMNFKRGEYLHWYQVFQDVHDGKIDTWDYQLNLALWINDMVSIMPNQNLISNIGFGIGATHTVGPSKFSEMPTYSLKFPLTHPRNIVVDVIADDLTSSEQFSFSPTKYFMKKIIPPKLIRWIRSKFL